MNQSLSFFSQNPQEFYPDTLVFGGHRDGGEEGALRVARQLKIDPFSVLGMATGDTTIPMYEKLVDLHRNGLDFSKATFFNLDEYIGLPANHPQSYAHYMQQHLFKHINAYAQNIHIPNGMAADIAAECDRYENLIKICGGIDLQILGVGENGHIGFCEPGTSFDIRTHQTILAELTRKNNAPNFPDPRDVPTHAITMGIATILDAREIILLANGVKKAKPINALLTQPITTQIPVTVLRRHPHVSVIIDRDAFLLAPRKSFKQAASHGLN